MHIWECSEKFKLNQIQNDQLAVIINRSHGSMQDLENLARYM